MTFVDGAHDSVECAHRAWKDVGFVKGIGHEVRIFLGKLVAILPSTGTARFIADLCLCMAKTSPHSTRYSYPLKYYHCLSPHITAAREDGFYQAVKLIVKGFWQETAYLAKMPTAVSDLAAFDRDTAIFKNDIKDVTRAFNLVLGIREEVSRLTASNLLKKEMVKSLQASIQELDVQLAARPMPKAIKPARPAAQIDPTTVSQEDDLQEENEEAEGKEEEEDDEYYDDSYDPFPDIF